MSFYPYNPVRLRWGLILGAAACVVLAAWALASARESGDIGAWARLGVLFGLLGAFAYVAWRIRPRENWGVRIEPLGMAFNRPLTGDEVQLVWSQISELRRDGKRGERLLILVRPEGRVLLNRHLFASNEVFEKLMQSLEERMPRRPLDA